MPITVDERDSLRQLVTFTKTELSDAGDPTNNLNNLQALTNGRMAEYQVTVTADRVALQVLLAAEPAASAFWAAAQEAVWVRLDAQLSAQDRATLFGSIDHSVKYLAKSLPLLASLRWTLTNFEAL